MKRKAYLSTGGGQQQAEIDAARHLSIHIHTHIHIHIYIRTIILQRRSGVELIATRGQGRSLERARQAKTSRVQAQLIRCSVCVLDVCVCF